MSFLADAALKMELLVGAAFKNRIQKLAVALG